MSSGDLCSGDSLELHSAQSPCMMTWAVPCSCLPVQTPFPFCTSTFSHHPGSPVTFNLKMFCIWSIKVFSPGPVLFDVHVVLISKEWFGLYEEINSAELVRWVKNNFQMQDFCDPSLARMILGYEINQLQNQSCSLQTPGVSSNKGHIHQRLVLRVKESIWL